MEIQDLYCVQEEDEENLDESRSHNSQTSKNKFDLSPISHC